MSRLFFSVDFCGLTEVGTEGGNVFDANNLHDELIELKSNASKLRSSLHVPSDHRFFSESTASTSICPTFKTRKTFN